MLLNNSRTIIFKKNFNIRNTDVTLGNTKWIRWPYKYRYCFCARIALQVKLMGDKLLKQWDFPVFFTNDLYASKNTFPCMFQNVKVEKLVKFQSLVLRMVFLSTSENLWYYHWRFFSHSGSQQWILYYPKRWILPTILPKVWRAFIFPHLDQKQNSKPKNYFNPLNAKLNPICHLLALFGAHHILQVSK